MSSTDAYTDVVELCAMLQCLGFSVKSLDTSDTNISQEGGTRTVVINCQSSGLHVVLESVDVTCSCPTNPNQQNSGFWQVSGITGGKQLNKECGSALLGSLPRAHRERLTRELQDMVRCIKEHNESDIEKPRDKEGANKSSSMVELKTPEKRHYQIKSETPTRYRSLDTLTTDKEPAEPLPTPGLLQKQLTSDAGDTIGESKKLMCQRQSTYTLSSTSNSIRRSNKTSSPIQAPSNTILESLIAAEKAAEDLRNKLSMVIREFSEDGKNDSSMSSLVLDVSKISVLKGGENSKIQFSSSPNLSGIGTVQEDLTSRLKRVDSASTSNIATSKSMSKEGKMSRIRRISPNIFKLKRDGASFTKVEKLKHQDKSGKLTSLLKPKIATPVRTHNADASPSLSASRKKFSHVKSTIPKPITKKE